MAAARKFGAAAKHAAAFGFGPGPGDAALPWDVVAEKLGELLRFLASVAQALAAELRERAASLYAAVAALARGALAVALPAAAAVALVLALCCCCGVAVGQRRLPRGTDREEVEGIGGGGPVVSYRRGGYKGGIFSMHPNKPIVG